MSTMTLGEIESMARQYATALTVLDDKMDKMTKEIEATKKRLMGGIENAAGAAAALRELLQDAIGESADLFTKPKTLVLAGIKCGFRKGDGKIEWADADQVVALIKKHLPDQSDLLINTTEKPIKDALGNLPANDLKRIGVSVVDAGDEVYVKRAGNDIEKLVNAFLGEGKKTNQEK
jgi:hypothetical protein